MDIMKTNDKEGFYVVTAKFYGPTNTKGSRVRCEIRGEKYWYGFDHALYSDNVYLDPIKDALAKFCSWDTEKDLVWARINDGMVAIAS